MKKNTQTGFTLVEMAFALLIMGLIVGAIFSFMKVQHEQNAQQVTAIREQKIATALTYYAQMHNYLPCPSLPKMTLPKLVGDEVLTCTTTAARNGVVPFRVLGLTQTDATDGYGNAISYTVSAPANKPPAVTTDVEYTCKTPAWIPSGTNVAPSKAQFCCQKVINPQLMVYTDALGTQTAAPIQSGAQFGPINTQVSATTATSISYFAYVLVSHGNNGYGAFTFCQDTTSGSCTNIRNILNTNGVGTSELANADDTTDKRYALLRSTSNDNANFDDIVLWRTQDRVIGELNNDSCAKP